MSLCALTFRPEAAEAAVGDEHWDSRFGLPGVTNGVYSLLSDAGRVYAGGTYTTVIATNSVNVWDGQSWNSIPGTFSSGSVVIEYAVAKQNSNIYVGGIFSSINGVPVRNLARWDGSSWSQVGGGVPGLVAALVVDGNDLYVAGSFTNLNGMLATNVARWDGAAWHALGAGIGPYSSSASTAVRLLALRGGILYAAGTFTTAGDLAVQNIAAWNGTSWSTLGSGVNGAISGLALTATDLYVGGVFTTAGVANATNVARWDGSSWSALGSGVNNAVNAVGVLSNRVYVGGAFTSAGAVSAARVASWDGSSWSALGNGMNDQILEIVPDGNSLLFGGLFTQADDLLVTHVARFDGSNWAALGNRGRDQGAATFARSVLTLSNRVYLGGLFTAVGGARASRIACWDGTNWFPLGSGLKGTNEGTGTAANVIAANGTNVYVGGSFTNAGGVAANAIARWNGTNWSALGSGVNGSVSAIAFLGSDVYVGGNFSAAGGITAFNIAKWDGAAWSALPGPFAGTINNFFVNALAVRGSDLYVAGSFFAGGNATNIARFSGGQWFSLDLSLNDRPSALAFIGSDLYVGGRFTSAGLLSANRIAKWNGSSWSALGTGIGGSGTPSVSALAAIGTNLFAAGTFTNAGGLYVNRIAKWDGTSWSAMGDGVVITPGNAAISSLSANSNDLYAAGTFFGAGGKPSSHIAHWNEQLDFVPRLQLSQPRRLTNGAFAFRITANAVPSYVLEFTTNFSSWTQLLTNSVTPFDFTNSSAAGSAFRFYRAR